MRIRLRCLPILPGLLGLLWLPAACGPEPAAPGPSGASGEAAPRAGRLDFTPSIVLITIDTLRRAHLGCYGYPRDTSPRIDGLAAEAVLFEQVLAPMASTFPSHLSILTGLYPFQHGLTSNRSSVRTPFHSEPGRFSIVPFLQQQGWATGVFASSVVLHRRTGIAAGFEVSEAPGEGAGPRPAEDTTDRALSWLALNDQGPFFLWVHYFDVHEPNEPPEPYRSFFRPDATLEAWLEANGLGREVTGERFAVSKGVARRFFERPDERADPEQPDPEGETQLDRAALYDLIDRYDGSIRYVDSQVGRLLDELAARGLYEHTIVAVAADHGQSLGEHDFYGHGQIVEVNTRIPLLVRFPGQVVAQPQRFEPQVSLVDLMPTLLARFELPGLETYREQLEGEDVLSGTFARACSLTQQATEFRNNAKSLLFALHSGRWKLLMAPEGPEALYDLEGAGEDQDVRAEHPDVVRRLEGEFARLLSRQHAAPGAQSTGPDSAETERMLQQLEALGYAGD